MLRLIPPKDAPGWLQGVLQQIERAIRSNRLPEFESTALPDPVPFRGTQILVTDLNMTAFSAGGQWRRSDTGATL